MNRSDDPFELLGIQREYDVDASQVQRAYLKASAAHHPDRFTDPLERAEAEETIAWINHAVAELSDDERRANCLLALLGGPSREREKALPDGFLIEILEQREEMEQALASGNPDERLGFERWAADRRRDHHEAVRALFARAVAMGEDKSTDAGILVAIRVELNAWRYIERMIEQLDPDYDHASVLNRSHEKAAGDSG